MTNVVLALGHPHGGASTVGTGTYWFAIGLLAGIVVCWFAPAWLTGLVVVFDLVALGWTTGILHYTDKGNGRWIFVAVIFLLIGLWFGVSRGLKHLGDWELRTRSTNIRKMGRYF